MNASPIEKIKSLDEKLPGNKWLKVIVAAFILWVILLIPVSIFWSILPSDFDPKAEATLYAESKGESPTTGFTTVYTLNRLMETLLTKNGGYISNDRLPPGVLLDNISNWEFGVLVQIRDMARSLRKDFSRSQSQSVENQDLTVAEPQFNFDSNSWMLPSTESQYQDGLKALDRYLNTIANPADRGAQFYARTDNLNNWLGDIQTRLGSLSQRLSASVGQRRVNTDLSGDPAATQSTQTSSDTMVKTGWFAIDDIFYEARGASWALIHLLKAVETDFATVLEKKNALVSLRQIIRELEATQETVWSPMIMNGSGFGLFANHSLVMANYISRANAAIIDMRELLQRG